MVVPVRLLLREHRDPTFATVLARLRCQRCKAPCPGENEAVLDRMQARLTKRPGVLDRRRAGRARHCARAISSLQSLLAPATAQSVLQALWERGQQRRAAMAEPDRDHHGSAATGQTSLAGVVLLMLAKHCFPQPPEVLKQLQRLAKAVRLPNQSRISRKNRTRLDQFKDPATLQRLLALPHTLIQEALALRENGRVLQAARLARTAAGWGCATRC